jgi:hypothetical protein
MIPVLHVKFGPHVTAEHPGGESAEDEAESDTETGDPYQNEQAPEFSIHC